MGQQEEHRIDLSAFSADFAGEVVIKSSRTYGDRQEIEQAARPELTRMADGAYAASAQNFAAANLKALERAIVTWPSGLGSLPACRCGDVRARVIPSCPRLDAIADLDEDLGDWLLAEVEEHYRQRRRAPAAKSGAADGPAVADGAGRGRKAAAGA